MSDTPLVPQKAPYKLDVQPGAYWWCSCGRSAKQPFCDGSHAGTGFSPVQTVITEARTVYFCGCKHSARAPFCDGAHNAL